MAKTTTTKKTGVRPTTGTKLPAITHAMTQRQIVAEIANRTGLVTRQVEDVWAATGDVAAQLMARGGAGYARLPKLGLTIKRSTAAARPARTARNPATGAPLKLKATPAHDIVRLKPGKRLREAPLRAQVR